MTLNYMELSSILEALKELQETKMTFKLSLIVAKNIEILEKEEAFYTGADRCWKNDIDRIPCSESNWGRPR